MSEHRNDCLLHGVKDNNAKCGAGTHCTGCGWERKEANRRRELMRIRGLTLCSDGLRRLVIGKQQA